MRIYIVFILLFFHCAYIFAQTQTSEIRINGTIICEKAAGGNPEIMVVNQRKGNGIFAGADGRFSISALKTDTIVIAAYNYQTAKICFKDSAFKSVYHAGITMKHLIVQLKEAEIFVKRDLNEIEKDISKLGYNKNDYMLSGVNSYSSPITFLYQEFSKRERNKRLVAEMRNEDNKRALLKELLGKYVDGNIIKLNTDEFDRFIDYCKVPEDFMKTSTQYEFIMYIKHKYADYLSVK